MIAQPQFCAGWKPQQVHAPGGDILAHLPGGDLCLEWREDTNHVFMTGPAAEVFTGVLDVEATDDSDSEGAGLTYSLTGGADQSLFDLDPNTGVLTFNARITFW